MHALCFVFKALLVGAAHGRPLIGRKRVHLDDLFQQLSVFAGQWVAQNIAGIHPVEAKCQKCHALQAQVAHDAIVMPSQQAHHGTENHKGSHEELCWVDACGGNLDLLTPLGATAHLGGDHPFVGMLEPQHTRNHRPDLDHRQCVLKQHIRDRKRPAAAGECAGGEGDHHGHVQEGPDGHGHLWGKDGQGHHKAVEDEARDVGAKLAHTEKPQQQVELVLEVDL